MISFLGHFGSHYSYAAVAAQVAGRVARQQSLGGLMNLDDEFLPAHQDLLRWVQPTTDRSRLLAITAPSPIFETIFSGYKNVGLFLCPNTDELSEAHTEILDQCRIGFAPSEYCAEAARAASKTPVVVCPLGVPESYAKRQYTRPQGKPFTFLHLTTDFFLPGRKGTKEVVEAWKYVRSIPDAQLIVHAPRSISTEIYYDLAEQETKDGLGYGRFKMVSPPPRGMTEDELADLLCSVDVVVLPSRCEGFGMVILAALVLGVPLITTDVTGQRDFLGDFNPLLCPTAGVGELAGEGGLAPLIHVGNLAESMMGAYENYDEVLRAAAADKQTRMKWTWPSVLNRWEEELVKWESAK